MSQCRPILDHEHPLAGDFFPAVNEKRGSGVDDDGRRIAFADAFTHGEDVVDVGRVDFVDHDDVSPLEIDLSRIIGAFVTRAVGVCDDDLQVGLEERKIVVPAVPEYDVGHLFRFPQNRFVIDPGKHRDAVHDVGFVLFHFLDGAPVFFHVGDGFELLYFLLHQIAVGHGMADNGHAESHFFQQ